ncbi:MULTISPECIES: trimeric intracellular cation channel family protein [unclassified Janthinobacterium]|uniref:trimeric intracellular cation channel family protein n=1 Tax=unclassified Janthinobacterium TaxID=2610881 RepID=UPI00088D0670|nr:MULTISPECIES: trimeric intracellular cation channel family protein [unclassified Janthinobacterium]APA69345.1 membrane protein [Janthinobacterium sp. 1_2014MBL_MicDiv]KAB8057666.1 trimeric intracellular cation channel family protein [Janthinobacterium sp. FT14W]MDN2712526.1 trimeric intracellular cation channel family protein [Janthinobacterium sp. SUN118]MED5597014.1 trimeric intracellular cation channel family protein [Janthinobacterium sp. P210006]NBV19252.1 trimeric intracellular cation
MMPPQLPPGSLIKIIEVIAILVGAFSGFIEARRKRMDLVGVFVVAFITAFGGGTLRDILLDKRPLFWVSHQEYAILIFVLALTAAPLIQHLRQIVSERLIVVADAIGLGMFAIAGVAEAMRAGMPIFIASMMGVITGIFGGVMRDIVCNEVPMVFRDGKPYAICAFFGCWAYLLQMHFGAEHDFALWTSASGITILRLICWKFDMRLGR